MLLCGFSEEKIKEANLQGIQGRIKPVVQHTAKMNFPLSSSNPYFLIYSKKILKFANIESLKMPNNILLLKKQEQTDVQFFHILLDTEYSETIGTPEN